MSHYGILQWADYARGVASPAERSAIGEHLSSGCAECRAAAVFWGTLARVSGVMAQQQAPESAVKLARAICPAAPRRAFRIPCELVFDSFLAPAPAGLRASWQVGWQALYRAGDCSLDLRIEPDPLSSQAALIGQVSNHATPDSPMSDVPVSLKSGKRVVAETRSNRFGEFQMEYDQQSRLELCVLLEGGAKRIVAPLRRVAVQAEGAGNAPRRANRANRPQGNQG
jgi:hypothetical protein